MLQFKLLETAESNWMQTAIPEIELRIEAPL